MALFVRRDTDNNILFYLGEGPPRLDKIPDANDDWLPTSYGSSKTTYSKPGDAFGFARLERWTRVKVQMGTK